MKELNGFDATFPHKERVVEKEGGSSVDFGLLGMGIDHDLVFPILSNLLQSVYVQHQLLFGQQVHWFTDSIAFLQWGHDNLFAA